MVIIIIIVKASKLLNPKTKLELIMYILNRNPAFFVYPIFLSLLRV